MRDPRVRRSRNDRVFYMECGGLKGGGVRTARPTDGKKYLGRAVGDAGPYGEVVGAATTFTAQVRADGFDFWGSKFPGGQVAEFDLDAFIGGGFGGFLQEFFSIFV